MKILFVIVLLFNSALAQTNFPVNKETNLVEYSDVVSVDTSKAEHLFSNAKIFVANAFKSGKNVTDLQDEKNYRLVVKGIIPVKYKDPIRNQPYGGFWFSFSIDCKDNRYRYSCTNFVHEGPKDCGSIEKEKSGQFEVPKGVWNKMKLQVADQMEIFISDLKKYMSSSTKETKDW